VAIEKTFDFADDYQTLAFVAHAQDQGVRTGNSEKPADGLAFIRQIGL
jgi:hypothetical protein